MQENRSKLCGARAHAADGRHPAGKRRARGYSLVEVLITVAVLGIMLGMAIPDMAAWIRETRLNSAIGPLVADLSFARSEAIKRNDIVIMCARSAGADTCAGVSGTSISWTNGWLVCYDRDSDGACDASSATDPNPIRVGDRLNPVLLLDVTTGVVRFNGAGNASPEATFTLTGNWSGSSSRIRTVVPSGQIRKP